MTQRDMADAISEALCPLYQLQALLEILSAHYAGDPGQMTTANVLEGIHSLVTIAERRLSRADMEIVPPKGSVA